MTRKDYVFLASLLRQWRSHLGADVGDGASRFGPDIEFFIENYLLADNPRFDPAKFWKAVGGR